MCLYLINDKLQELLGLTRWSSCDGAIAIVNLKPQAYRGVTLHTPNSLKNVFLFRVL